MSSTTTSSDTTTATTATASASTTTPAPRAFFSAFRSTTTTSTTTTTTTTTVTADPPRRRHGGGAKMFFAQNGREYFSLSHPSPEILHLTEQPSNLVITQALLNAMVDREKGLRAACGHDCAQQVAAEFGFEDQLGAALLVRREIDSL